MNKNDMQNLIADFYRVCLFGTKYPDIEAAAKRAYIDLCRTIYNTKEDSRNKAKDEVIKLILSQTKELEICKNICFDKFHETLCDEIIQIYKRYNIECYYRQAQKWKNMTMKYLSVIGEEKYSWLNRLYPFLHIPIDSVILGKIIGDFEIKSVAVKGKRVLLKNLSWSRIDKDTYDAIQNVLREKIGENEIPIVWEFKAWNNPKENE